MRSRLFIVIAALVLLTHDAAAQSTRGIAGREAPEFGVSTWFNLPEGAEAVDVGDYRGKVLYLYCFQSWCPGCHSAGFPTLRTLLNHYEDSDDVAFVAVQTTFEGFATNDAQAAQRTARRYELEIPVGHDGSDGKRSTLMGRYRTGGTPWTVIIDSTGVVQYNDFHIKPRQAITLIDRLRAEAVDVSDATRTKKVQTLPKTRGVQDRVGEKMPELVFETLLDDGETDQDNDEADKPTLTLYRWWTNGCPFCEKSLPAIETLREKYGERGLRTVAVYHPKPPRRIQDATVREFIDELGYTGPVATDLDWSELRKALGTLRGRRATSVSFLVDHTGVIRFVHPGPEFFPSEKPGDAQHNADYELLERAIDQLLKEQNRDQSGEN